MASRNKVTVKKINTFLKTFNPESFFSGMLYGFTITCAITLIRHIL